MEDKITIVNEATSHEKTGGTGAGCVWARVSRRTFEDRLLAQATTSKLDMSRQTTAKTAQLETYPGPPGEGRLPWGRTITSMRRSSPPDPYVEAKLLGIMLAGAFGQTRGDCSSQSKLRQELRPSGTHRIPGRGSEPPEPHKA